MTLFHPHRSFRFAALLLAAALGAAHALYTDDMVLALKIPDKSLTIDGKPDSLWRMVYAQGGRASRPIAFDDYGRMVILQPQDIRNDDPSKYVKNPVKGSAVIMAAFDSQALYFFFLVKTRAVAVPKNLSCATADLWKADAAEVFVDPSPWSRDTADYRSYFTADASNHVYGTSPRTIQLDKPITPRETNFYFRNRVTADRFQEPASKPAGVLAVSANNPSDTTLVGVEMKIPFWAAASEFTAGRSMFISWGFNMYGDSARGTCSGNPLAYRWAKHTLNYDVAPEKPPGWLAKDSTHYDPTRSWDGWGQLYLNAGSLGPGCHWNQSASVFNANWDTAIWGEACREAVTQARSGRFPGRLDAAGMPIPSRALRDLRGRLGPAASPAFRVPL
jgi:hypothetical protein